MTNASYSGRRKKQSPPSRLFNVKLYADEFDALDRAAHAVRMNRSEWARTVLMRAAGYKPK
jgi:hypothetical protein